MSFSNIPDITETYEDQCRGRQMTECQDRPSKHTKPLASTWSQHTTTVNQACYLLLDFLTMTLVSARTSNNSKMYQ